MDSTRSVRRKLVLTLIGLSVAVATLAPSASATAPLSVSGTWSTTPPTPAGFKQAGVNIELPAIVHSTWAGNLTGTTVATATFLIHPDGSIVAAPTHEAFTGTVAGVGSGTLDFVEEAHAQPDGSTQIDATVVRGTGDLEALRGRLMFVGSCDVSGACAGTYSGQIQD
jgi:hypothetical protein